MVLYKIKRGGRPKSPDVQPMTLRIDKILHLELKKQARLLGIGKSAKNFLMLKIAKGMTYIRNQVQTKSSIL